METMTKKEYFFSNDVGDATITVYNVFPGVQIVYHSVHMDQLDLGAVTEGNLIEIHHCREGRIEQRFTDEHFYLMPGDLSVALRTVATSGYHFPLRHYHGITIGINVDLVSDAFLHLLTESGAQPLAVTNRLRGDKNCFIIRSEKYIEHIFSELYSVPENIKAGYFKVKIWELFLVLSGVDLQRNRMPECALPKTHVQLANQVAAYLSEHMDQHITIPELAQKFAVSDTHLKSVFKAVYGVPVYSYIRIQKMQLAAQMLIHTDRPITEIACEFGYSNTSKFSAAFQKIMGETPGDYRRAHSKLR